MSKWISEAYIKMLMQTDRLLQGNCEYKQWEREVEKIVDAMPSIDIVRCKECKWLRYCETEDLDLYLDCDKPDGGGIPRSEEWFCADGEREGE